MSSEFERPYSIDELKKRNQPQEPQMIPPALICPTPEQWAQMVSTLNAQQRLLKAMSSTLGITATQAEKLTEEVADLRQQFQPAGRKNGWQPSLPKIHLPKPRLAWLWAIPILVGLYALWPLWAILWSVVSPLLQFP